MQVIGIFAGRLQREESRQMFELDRLITLVSEPRDIPTLDAGEFPLGGGDPEPACCVAAAGSLLQIIGEPVRLVGNVLSQLEEPGPARHPLLAERLD